MQADFLDAHERHWQDAELLLTNQRLANADHLYGMSAECGLKRLMLAFGMTYDFQKNLPSDRKDQQHVDRLWMRYDDYRTGHHQGMGYGLPPANPFSNWHASQRYSSQADFSTPRVTDHRTGAELVCNLIRKARREGLL